MMRKAKEFILKMDTMRSCSGSAGQLFSSSPSPKANLPRGWPSKADTPPPEPIHHRHHTHRQEEQNAPQDQRSRSPPDHKPLDELTGKTLSATRHTYRSTFKSEWTLKWPYIVRDPESDPHVFFCEICKKTVSCAHQGLRDVTRHLESSGHHKMNLTMNILPSNGGDLLSSNLSLKALRESGELSIVTTPPHDEESDQEVNDLSARGSVGLSSSVSPPGTYTPLQAGQAMAASNGQLNPALKDVQCPICFKVFSRKFSLEMHFLIHQGLKPYTCQHCGRSFRQKGTLMRHTAIHSQTPSYRCGLCDRSYRQKNVFLHHLRNRHKISTDMLDRRRSKSGGQDEGGSPHSFLDGSGSPNGVHETVYPPPESTTGNSLLSKRAPASPEPVSSTIIPSLPSFSPQIPLGAAPMPNPLFLPGLFGLPPLGFPSQAPQMSPQKSWRCPFCPYETLNDDTDGCRKHLLQHINESPYSCLACGQRCFNEKELIMHIQDVHGPTNPVGLGSVAALQAAVNKCYQSAIPEQNEEQCEPLSLSRVKEERRVRNTEMTFTCIPCKADFASEEDLECHAKTHIQSVLQDTSNTAQVPEDLSTKSRKRSYADASYDSSSDVPMSKSSKSEDSDSDHKKDHEKPPKRQFLCVDCNKVFNSKHVYRYHVQMHISVAKTFRCGVCKITFAKKHELLQHTRQTHMKKYACAKCGKHFSYRSIYQRHEKDCNGKPSLLDNFKMCSLGAHERHQKAGSLPLIDVSLASSALGRDLIGVIPLLGDENQKGNQHNIVLGVPVINPSILQTHHNFLQNLLVVRNMA